MLKKFLALSLLSLMFVCPSRAQAPEALIGTVVNTGLTAGLGGATSEAFGGSVSRVRTVRSNLRVRYIGAGNYANDRRFYGNLRSYKSRKGDVLVSNSLNFSAQIAGAAELGLGISSLEEAKTSSLRLEFPEAGGYPAVSCEAKPLRIRKQRNTEVYRISYALDIRMRRNREGNEVVTTRRGSCQALVGGELKSVAPFHQLEKTVPVTLLVNSDSQFEVLAPRSSPAVK